MLYSSYILVPIDTLEKRFNSLDRRLEDCKEWHDYLDGKDLHKLMWDEQGLIDAIEFGEGLI